MGSSILELLSSKSEAEDCVAYMKHILKRKHLPDATPFSVLHGHKMTQTDELGRKKAAANLLARAKRNLKFARSKQVKAFWTKLIHEAETLMAETESMDTRKTPEKEDERMTSPNTDEEHEASTTPQNGN